MHVKHVDKHSCSLQAAVKTELDSKTNSVPISGSKIP